MLLRSLSLFLFAACLHALREAEDGSGMKCASSIEKLVLEFKSYFA